MTAASGIGRYSAYGVFRTPEELRRAAAGIPSLIDSEGENLRPAGEGRFYALFLHGPTTRTWLCIRELPLIHGEVEKGVQHQAGRAVCDCRAETPRRLRRRASDSKMNVSLISPGGCG